MIQAYVSHFNATTLEVRNLDQSIAMLALASNLQKNELEWLLTKTYLGDFARILAQAKKYARTEEAFILEKNPFHLYIRVEEGCGGTRRPKEDHAPDPYRRKADSSKIVGQRSPI